MADQLDAEAPATVEPGTPVPPISQMNLLPIFLATDELGLPVNPDLVDWIDRQAKDVCRTTKAAIEARAEFLERRANQLKLFAGVIPALGPPAEGAKAPHLAIMCKAVLHLWARTFDQVIPAKGDIVHSVPFGPGDQDRAIRTERHLNWQLRQRMPDWSSGHQANIMGWYLGGSQFRHYRFDPVEGVHRVDTIGIDDIILPFTERDDHPLMKSLPWLTRVLRLPRWQAEIYVERGMWSNLDAVFPADDVTPDGETKAVPNSDDESEVQKAVVAIQGVDRPDRADRHTKREYYEQQTYLKFPEGTGIDGLDGKTKPVILTVDKITKKPVALTIREEPDPVDQARFDQEQKALDIRLKNEASQAAMAAPGTVVPPSTAKQPRPVRQQTIYNIVHYRLFPNPEGVYGLGVGYLLEGSNELANALAAEYLVSARLENLQGGFMAQGTREKRGDMVAVPGKWMETQLEPEVLTKALLPYPHHPPSEGLMKVAEKLEKNSEIAANADILSGERGASNETAKGMMVRNSNAMALISVMTRLYLEALKYEIKMIAHGNAVQMDGPETFPHQSQTGPDESSVENVTVRPEDYIEDIHVEFTADARMSSKPERIADAMNVFQGVVNSPLVQNQILVDFCQRKVFRAMESPDYEAAMGPPPKPAEPPKPMSQEDENAGFINEQTHPPLPEDNHAEHLHKMEEFAITPFYKEMSSTGRQIFDKHKRAHMAFLYQQLSELQSLTGVNIHGEVGAMGGAAGGPGGPEVPGPPNGAPGPGGGSPPGDGALGGPPPGEGGGSPM
jgi:hypothetical protein